MTHSSTGPAAAPAAGRFPRRPFRFAALAGLAVLTAAGFAAVPAAVAEAAGFSQMDRVQLHRNGNRSVPYLPLARKGASAGASILSMRAIKKIPLDGNPLQNTYGGLRPIDGDGDFESSITTAAAGCRSGTPPAASSGA